MLFREFIKHTFQFFVETVLHIISFISLIFILTTSCLRISSLPPGPTPVVEETITQFLETPYQLEPRIPRLTRTDIQININRLNPKRIPRLRSHHR
jgi:hypothetical protein